MCALSRLVTGSAGTTGQRGTVPASNRRNGVGTDVMSDMRNQPLRGDVGQEFFDALSNPAGYDGSLTENGNGMTGGLSGYSSQESESYLNAYMLMKDYPQWVALLNANPYKGLNVPDSLFDRLGLSNKQQDKMIALRRGARLL